MDLTNLDLARLKLLAFTAVRTDLAAGDLLFEQGSESDAAYVVIAGTADILIGPVGKPVRVSGIVAPAIIGEMGVVTGAVRSATIRATSKVTVPRLQKDIFLALMEEFPDLALSVMGLIVGRLQDNVTAVSRRDFQEASSRD